MTDHLIITKDASFKSAFLRNAESSLMAAAEETDVEMRLYWERQARFWNRMQDWIEGKW